jgi:transmembrane 9 superfamily protein 2/4
MATSASSSSHRRRRRHNGFVSCKFLTLLTTLMMMLLLLRLLLSLPSIAGALSGETDTEDLRAPQLMNKIKLRKKLTSTELNELNVAEQRKYKELRKNFDEVSNTKEAAMLRDYRLRHKKRKGLLRKRYYSLAEVLFPGVSPQDYSPSQVMDIYVDLVESRKTQVPFEYYDLPTCEAPALARELTLGQRQSWNLGSRLQGHKLTLSPFTVHAKQDVPCTPLCLVKLEGNKLRWLRKLVERQYRVYLTLDQLPVLRRNKEFNYVVQGYPVGFQGPPGSGVPYNEFYLYNHLKFTISYNENPEKNTIRIIGFDVHPVSIQHDLPTDWTKANKLTTCNDNVMNDPSTHLNLRPDITGTKSIIYSYEVQWQPTDIQWADRWDVYLLDSPDDDIHYFSIVSSLMIVVFFTGAITAIMNRTLRKDIAGYNEMQTLEDAQEETNWKSLHGDVFRPPQFSPMLLSVLVGTGAQIGVAFMCAMLCAILGLLNPMNKGQTLTAITFLYVLSGSIAGYISARLYKFCQATAWKQTTILTATLLPGLLVVTFSILNIFLSVVGAATAVSFFLIVAFFLLWTCVMAPLVFLGSFFGLRANKIEVSTNPIARMVPSNLPWFTRPPISVMLGGILPFGTVNLELFFIMSALWLHQIYCAMGFLLAVLFILAATCAQVSMVMCYMQLCAEDHRWWWKSFWNCASAGVYLFLYSLWFWSSRLHLVGVLPVVVYLTYMSMISICFGLFCGAIGVLTNFWFIRTIYGAVKSKN